MINTPKELSDIEVGLYKSGYGFCEKLVKEEHITIAAAVEKTAAKFGGLNMISDMECFKKFLFSEVTAYTEPSIGVCDQNLEDKTWWDELKQDSKFKPEYWSRYYDYLLRKPSWSITAVEDINSSTDEIMNALTNPRKGVAGERMGMVFGYVQSGKTAHYIGMINKAYDAGYRIVIVLSGIHNSLRSQTQSRIDEEVLGYETSLESIGDMTRERNVIGVGVGPHNQVETVVQSITTRDEKGDVNKKTEGVSMMPPFMIVTKKNASVLRKILRFFRKNHCAEIIGGKKKIPAKYPALIIDDEADQASINTKESYDDQGNVLDDYNPTTINGLIRELLGVFECRSYIGYTATPFANIFIPPHIDDEKYGTDLFPRDFIYRAPRADQYIGAREFFGLGSNEDIPAMPLYRKIVDGAIDIVIGGPPCQGFSNANRQKNHAISQNNMLVKQYIRAIRELQPKAFVMENVSMLRSDVHRFYMEETDLDIVEEYQIPNKNTPLHLLSSEFVFDGALEIVQNLELLQQRLWPENHYRELNIIYKGEKNTDKMKKSLEKHRRKLTEIAQAYIEDDADNYIAQKSREAFQAIMDYFDGVLEANRIHTLIEPAIMIQRMLSKAREIFDNHIHVDSYECTEKDGLLANIRSFAVFDYLKGILTSGEDGYAINSGVLCAADFGAPQKRERFVVMGIKKSISAVVFLPSRKIKDGHYKTVHDAIYDLEDVPPVYDLADDEEGIPLEHKEQLSSVAQQLRDSDSLKNHIITKTTDVAMARFKALHQGENFHSLEESLKTNTYTDVKRTQNTIYLRLNYNEPSGTVLNVRKSMWIHPTLDRAISIREAARLQTFPDSFVFCGSKDKQYQQVGNAVPPIMAKAIAKQLAATLGKKLREAEQENG